MRKSSKLTQEIPESCRWWEGGIEWFAEWTFEGSLNRETSVGADGNRSRYLSGVYNLIYCTWQSGRFVKLSGTAIIRFYYRLRQGAWGGFFILNKKMIFSTE